MKGNMKKIIKLLIATQLVLSISVMGQTETPVDMENNQEIETFYLANGQKIIGTVTAKNDSTGVYNVQTAYGSVTFNASDLKVTRITIELTTGEVFTGDFRGETDTEITIKSSLGILNIKQELIKSMTFLDEVNRQSDGLGLTTPQFDQSATGISELWYYADERLIDIFFDPTGYTLKANTLYFSGLSWGYAVSDNFQITSNWSRYFRSDLNVRAKYQILQTGDIKQEKVASLGAHVHLGGPTNKWERKQDGQSWNGNDYYVYDYIGSDEEKLWFEAFGAYTISTLKASGQGRTNYTIGSSLTVYPGETPMPRFYAALSSDVRKKFKVLAEMYYDKYSPSMSALSSGEKITSPLQFDFGFVYAKSENFHFGVHYQRPWLIFYYKF